MSRVLKVHRSGPGVTVQDLGRAGHLDSGLSRGGAADRLALAEGAALLRQGDALAALEMAGMGGEFEAAETLRIALTGAPMQASLEGEPLRWNASHTLPAGARLTIGAAREGIYGYLHVGGGFDTPVCLGARSAHLVAGIGGAVEDGSELSVGDDARSVTGEILPKDDRFDGGTIRLVASVHTGLFAQDQLERLESTVFRRDSHGNRMGARLAFDGEGFLVEGGRTVVSEVIVPGDIQITGDGTPFVLLAECQTTGGYPRIATVVPADLPRIAQTPAGPELRFRFVTLDEAVEIERKAAEARAALPKKLEPLIRDPRRLPDLLAYQLISGVTAGDDLDHD